jgi:hypothetical protein
MRDVIYLAEHICDTEFVPKGYRGNAPATAAAILAGRELNLPPMTALRHIQVVEGSASLSAEYKRARVLAAGNRLDIDEHTHDACTVTGRRKGHEPVTVRFTMADARRAGLVKDRGAYMTRPRRMLFARACTEVVDALFPDLTNGLPTTELLEEEAELAEPAAPAQGRATAADLRRPAVTAVAGTVTPDAPSAQAASPVAAEPPRPPQAGAGGAPAAFRGQLNDINRRLEQLGYAGDDQRETRIRVTCLLAGLGPEDIALLTHEGAAQVLKQLGDADEAGLAALLEDLREAEMQDQAGEPDGQ